jgi:hypothetical protein
MTKEEKGNQKKKLKIKSFSYPLHQTFKFIFFFKKKKNVKENPNIENLKKE